MKPAPFDYYRANTLDEALDYLAEYGDEAKVIAGGQSLIPTMNFRLAQPAILIDLNPVAEMAYIKPGADNGLHIGAMTRQRAVEKDPLIADRAPLIQAAMPTIAHPQIRNRGTFGGSIAHADPSAELPAVILALEATLTLRSRRGERSLPARDFFVDLFTTALAPDELLIEVSLPAQVARSGWGFSEVSRRHGDFAIVGAVAALTLDEADRCRAARLVFISVGPGPVEATQAARQLQGQPLTDEAIAAAANTAARQDIDPSADIHASVAYRRHLAEVLAQRVLHQAAANALMNNG